MIAATVPRVAGSNLYRKCNSREELMCHVRTRKVNRGKNITTTYLAFTTLRVSAIIGLLEHCPSHGVCYHDHTHTLLLGRQREGNRNYDGSLKMEE